MTYMYTYRGLTLHSTVRQRSSAILLTYKYTNVESIRYHTCTVEVPAQYIYIILA